MTLMDAFAKLKAIGLPVLRSADAAAALKIGKSHASVMLSRLSRYGHAWRLKRGLWLLSENIDPLALTPYLTAPFPSYISAHSALYYHGMISQVPEAIVCVSSARTRTYRTPLGTFSVHHIQPVFFFDYESAGESRVVCMATPEKAIVDFLYLRPARSRRFCALPELELPARFKVGHARALIRRIPDRRRRTMVSRAFESLLKSAQR